MQNLTLINFLSPSKKWKTIENLATYIIFKESDNNSSDDLFQARVNYHSSTTLSSQR